MDIINIWQDIKEAVIRQSKIENWDAKKAHLESPKDYLPYRFSVKKDGEINVVKGSGKSKNLEDYIAENPKELGTIKNMFIR